MSFLQPWLLLGLPLLFLPIIIHLINQWRYQTKKWGAMMFLLAANRMARGYAKLRQYLILAMRMLAIAGLVFAIARPLASGLLGFSGGKADTTILLLDRSPSMQLRELGGSETKLETARRQLRKTFETLGSNRWVLIDSANQETKEFETAQQLFDAPAALGASASADLPSMLSAAVDYLKNNRPGQTEIWICSDMRQSDWDAASNQWSAVRDAIKQFPQNVRFHLLSYDAPPNDNISVRVTDVHRDHGEDSHELVMSLLLTRAEGATDKKAVPIQIEVNGARSELAVELTGSSIEIKDHRVAVEKNQSRGWGRVTIPADANNADNDFYFVFDQPPARRTVVIGQDPQATFPLEIAAGISPEPHWKAVVEKGSFDQSIAIDWDDAGLLLWQGPLPNGSIAEEIKAFVKRGGYVMFFPPTPDPSGSVIGMGENSNELFGVRWNSWKGAEKVMVDNWRGDQDLLASTKSGASLPVGEVELKGHATLSGEITTLASLSGSDPLFARATTEHGGVYFCTASTSEKFSSLARSGVVLYVSIQRALDRGLESLGSIREMVAGKGARGNAPTTWQQVAGPDEILSTEYAVHSGIYDDGDKMISINRSLTEDQTTTLENEQVDELFQGLDFSRVASNAGAASSIVREIWRVFLVLMIIALITEAAMCIPKIARAPMAARPFTPPNSPQGFGGGA